MVRTTSLAARKQKGIDWRTALVIAGAIGLLLLSRGRREDLNLFLVTEQSNSGTQGTSTPTVLTQETPQRTLTVDTANNGGQRDFYEIASKTGTDKVLGQRQIASCLKDNSSCQRPAAVNPKCRVLAGHFYHTMYNKWLGAHSTDDAEPFQFLEIGHYNGKGFDAYKEFLPRAEHHSMEIACIEPGPREEGKVGTVLVSGY
jgi:hypothetical protein